MELLFPKDLVFQLTEGPLGCTHVVAQNPHSTWFALGGSSSPPHLLSSTNTHKNTAVILSLFMCLKVIPDFGTTILSYHQPFCLISCCGQGHCWNTLTSLLLSMDSLSPLLVAPNLNPAAFVSAIIMCQKNTLSLTHTWATQARMWKQTHAGYRDITQTGNRVKMPVPSYVGDGITRHYTLPLLVSLSIYFPGPSVLFWASLKLLPALSVYWWWKAM